MICSHMPDTEKQTTNHQYWTPGDRSGGFLFDPILLPLLAVAAVSLIMIAILSQVKITAEAAEPQVVVDTQIALLFTPEVRYWEQKIITWSEEWTLDPNLIATVMQIESCGNPSALSSAGAMGLFQVMPYHFSDNENPYKPNINARRGLSFLKQTLEARAGEPRLGLAGYNAGITGAKQPEQNWPAETIRYVYWGTGIYQDAIKGKAHSERLEEWLSAGGASLCTKAAQNLGIP